MIKDRVIETALIQAGEQFKVVLGLWECSDDNDLVMLWSNIRNAQGDPPRAVADLPPAVQKALPLVLDVANGGDPDDSTGPIIQVGDQMYTAQVVPISGRRAALMLQDVTAEYAAYAMLAQASQKHQRIFDALPTAVCEISDDGRITRCNPAAREVFGLSDLQGLNIAQVLPDMDWVLDKKRGDSGKVRARRRVGDKFEYFNATVRHVDLTSGAWLVCVTDVSEIMAAQLAIEETARSLRQSNSDLEHYAYVTSHDLQAPLRIMSSFAGLLEEEYAGVLDERGKTYLKHIVDHAKQGQDLIHALLNFSQVGRDVDFKLTSTNDALESVRDMFSRTMKTRNVTLTSDDLPDVVADPILLRQCLQNLVGNAIKFRKPGQKTTIHVSCDTTDSHWILHVKDDGIGLDMRYAKSAFLIFKKLHTTKKSGIGAGLAICKRIAERHGGDCWLESELGTGTTVSFSLARPS